MRTTLILAAAIVFTGIGSASACSYTGVDIAVKGNGDVVEVVDLGDANQITGQMFGNFSELRNEIVGNCNVIVTRQDGSFTRTDTFVAGFGNAIGTLVAEGATVFQKVMGDGNTSFIDATTGDVRSSVNGDGNQLLVQIGFAPRR